MNKKTGDARISGSLASLAGLESALLAEDAEAIENAIKTILLLHSFILSFGGIPLLYYGDAIGTLNDDSYLNDANKSNDNRWIHRPKMNWSKAEQRAQSGSVEYKIFNALKKLIAIRKEISAFADKNNRELINVDNPHLFVFSRFNQTGSQSRVLVVGNFKAEPQILNVSLLKPMGFFQYDSAKDLCTGEVIALTEDALVLPALSFYWLET